MNVQAYLFFNGRCEEAIEFYRKTLGAELDMLMRYKESPEPPPPGMVPPGWENKVMHASFRIGETTLMAADDCTGKTSGFQGIQLTLVVADETESKQRYAALAEGGQAKMPLTKTFYSPSFGMLVDRFGVNWMVIVMGQ